MTQHPKQTRQKRGAKIGRPFEAGNPGGPGRPPTPPEIKSARQLNQIEVERIYHDILGLPEAKLEEWKKAEGRTVLEAAVAKVMLEAVRLGDVFRIEKVLDRCVGPVKTKVEHSGQITLEDLVAGSRKEK